jgi:O-antigen/teichoic acid export membrane protein
MNTDGGARPESGQSVERRLLNVTKQATGVMTFQLLGMVLAFGANIVYARILGAELLGVYVLATTLLLVLSLVASFGTGPTMVRYVPVVLSRGKEPEAAGLFRLAVRIVLIAGAACAVLVLATRGFIAGTVFKEPRLLAVLPLTALGIIPASLAVLLGWTLRSVKQTAKDAFGTEVVYKLSKLLIFLALFLTLGLRLRALVIAFTAGYLVSGGAMLIMVRRTAPFFLRRPRGLDVPTRTLLAFCGTMFFVAFLNYAMSITDRLMLGMLSTSEAVGIYNVAFIVSNILTLAYMGINVSFAPVISELYHGGRIAELRSLYESLTRVMIIAVAPMLIWFVGFGDDLLRLFGREFSVGYAALIVLGLGAFSRSAVGSVGNMLMMSKHERLNAWNIVVSLVSNILLNMYFIPRYGVLGAAVATAISLAGINLVGLIEVRALFGFTPYRRSYLKLAGAIGLVAAGTLYARAHTPELSYWQFLPILVATYAVFLGLIALLGIEREDRVIMLGFLRRLGVGRR